VAVPALVIAGVATTAAITLRRNLQGGEK
jgi:hypothetical protein